jgi:uncharacterized protein
VKNYKIRIRRKKLKRTLIYLSLILAGPIAHAASFDCAKAVTSIEKTICSSSRISDLDTQLTQSYKKSLSVSADVEFLKSEQRAWLTNVRNKCQDAACLTQAYTDRIAKLEVAVVPTTTPPIKAVSETSASSQEKTSEVAASSATQVAAVEPSTTQPVAPIPATPPPPAKVEANAQAAPSTPSSPKVEAASPSSSAPTSFKFPFTFSVVLRALFALTLLAFIIGMIRPILAARFIKEPSRKRIFLSSLIILIPFGFLSEYMKNTQDSIEIASETQGTHSIHASADNMQVSPITHATDLVEVRTISKGDFTESCDKSISDRSNEKYPQFECEKGRKETSISVNFFEYRFNRKKFTVYFEYEFGIGSAFDEKFYVNKDGVPVKSDGTPVKFHILKIATAAGIIQPKFDAGTQPTASPDLPDNDLLLPNDTWIKFARDGETAQSSYSHAVEIFRKIIGKSDNFSTGVVIGDGCSPHKSSRGEDATLRDCRLTSVSQIKSGSGSHAEAVNLLAYSTYLGHSIAPEMLGDLYLNGWIGLDAHRPDSDNAIDFFELARTRGNLDANIEIADILEYGNHKVDKNISRAILLLEQGAKNNMQESIRNLVMLANKYFSNDGRVTEIDANAARIALKRLGSDPSQSRLPSLDGENRREYRKLGKQIQWLNSFDNKK